MFQYKLYLCGVILRIWILSIFSHWGKKATVWQFIYYDKKKLESRFTLLAIDVAKETL